MSREEDQYLEKISGFCRYIYYHTDRAVSFCLLDKKNQMAALLCFILIAWTMYGMFLFITQIPHDHPYATNIFQYRLLPEYAPFQ